MRFSVKQDIPGRLRLRVQGLRHNRALAKWLETELGGLAGVRIDARFRSGSLVLTFAPATGLRRQLLAQLQTLTATGPLAAPLALASGHCDLVCSRCHPDRRDPPSLVRQVIGVVALTLYVAWVALRQGLLKKPVSEAPLSLTSAVALVAAYPLLRHAWDDLRSGRHKSLFPFLAATCFLAIFLGQALTALEVIWILRIGLLLEDYVGRRSHRAIREILELTQKQAFILVDGVEVEIPVEQIHAGATVVCHPGEKIPVDGLILNGEALVDEAPVTGRAEPEMRHAGDSVYAGTIIYQGVIFVRAERVGDATYLCRILHLVESSLSNRAPAEKRADMLANRLMKLGLVAVSGTLLLTLSPTRAFTVLLVLACPCATVLAASTAVSAALANAARNQVLIKGGYYLEQIAEADCFCFDKTGTLTLETPTLISVTPRSARQNPDRLLALAAAAERHTQHPMARAIVAAAQERGLNLPVHAQCHFVIGRGVAALIDGAEVLVGNDKWMQDNAVAIDSLAQAAREQAELGYSLVYVARAGRVSGLLAIANPVRPRAAAVLAWLRADGVKEMHLVTGDTDRMARAVAEQFAFDSWRAELLPEDKARYLKELEATHERIVMVGDGVNDALALANARVGIAMGAGGAEVAIEAADIALADSALERLVKLRQLSRKTLRTIEQNHQLAMWTNLGGVIFGAAGLLTPLMAGALHIVHTLGIVVNSGRLLGWDSPGLGPASNELTPPATAGTDAGASHATEKAS